MLTMEQILTATLPLNIKYTGTALVNKKLAKLTVVELVDLNIGFLSPEGNKGCKMKGGGFMWILDVCINYSLCEE